MAVLLLILLMMSSFQNVQSVLLVIYGTEHTAYWDNKSHQCLTGWGNFSAGSVVHVYYFYGETFLVCKEGNPEFDLARSYIKIYGVKIPPTGEYKTTKCGKISYKLEPYRRKDGKHIVVKFYIYKDQKNSATTCNIKQYQSCARVGETVKMRCSVVRCTEQGWFHVLSKGCRVSGKCLKPGTKISKGWWWSKETCVCQNGGNLKC